jgi:hypothetical protein
MPVSRKDARGGRAFVFPLFGILFLLACYLIIAEWQAMPSLIGNALASVPWLT